VPLARLGSLRSRGHISFAKQKVCILQHSAGFVPVLHTLPGSAHFRLAPLALRSPGQCRAAGAARLAPL